MVQGSSKTLLANDFLRPKQEGVAIVRHYRVYDPFRI